MTDHQGPGPSASSGGAFDYFGDLSAHSAPAMGAESAWHEAGLHRRPRSWRGLFQVLFIGVCVWFAWQYHDLAQYSFRAAQEPLQLGDVTTFTPDLVPHNAYVCVDGISEHRGMTQSVSRILGQSAQLFWYFRLVGSRGIFVEVPPDAERFGTTQAMHVCGRAVDPEHSPTFHKLIAAYQDMFATEVLGPVRIVEEGMRPHVHRLRYSLFLSGLALALGLQTWALYRRWR